MTKFLDLDSVTPEAEFVLKLNGKDHPLKTATVRTFVDNMKDIESLALDATVVQEIEISVKIIKRAFPTITDEELDELTLDQVKAISEYALGANGEKVEAQAGDEGNAPAEK